MKKERPLSPEAKATLERAKELAEGGGIGPEHIFVAALEHAPELNELLGWQPRLLQQRLSPLPGEGFTAEADEVVLRAMRLCQIDYLGAEWAESVLLRLIQPESSLGKLMSAEQKRRVTDLLLQAACEGEEWTRLDLQELSDTATREGFVDANSGHYLRAILARQSLARKILDWLGLDRAELEQLAREDRTPMPMGPLLQELVLAQVKPLHLIRAALSSAEVLRIASEAGVVAFRLETAVARLQGHPAGHEVTSIRFAWMRPACEEAARLGGGMVTERDILLGLLADESSLACSALVASGMSLKDLRARLEQRKPESEGFSPGAQQAMQRAATLAESLSPHDGYMLLGVLPELGDLVYPTVEAQLQKRIAGSLERSLPVTCQGLAPGMSREQVIDRLGAPPAHERGAEQERWRYIGGPDIVWHPTEDRIQALMGQTLEQAGAVVLRSGDGAEAQRELLGEANQVELPGGLVASSMMFSRKVALVTLEQT